MLEVKKYLILVFILASLFGRAQEDEKPNWKWKDNVSVDGYVKFLPSVSFTKAEDLLTNNLIHHRINFKGYFGDNLATKVSFRNRVIYGEQVRFIPNYGEMIVQDDGEMDLSFLLVNEDALVVHSIIDRMYLDFAKNKWQVRLGRQRINWGINMAWNTNDLFNAYNIVDFDYQEKAGSDALRIQYSGKILNSELAIRPGENLDKSVIGGLVKFNKWKYDFQALAANYYQDIALGVGWAGNIKKMGFKGESTFFQDKDSAANTLVISSSLDYFFKKGTYLNFSVLYSSNGENTFNPSVLEFTSSTLSAKRLMPTKMSYLVQVSNQFNPRVQASMVVIYGQGMDILFVMPSVNYSIADNWELTFTGQSFFASQNNDFGLLNNSVFLGFRWSY